MNSQFAIKLKPFKISNIKKLPDSPGIYVFKQKIENEKVKDREILYIGKATSLQDRVRSYFSKDLFLARGPRITKMIEEADSLEFIETDSVLEALILEASLIKKHKPKYNVREKDQKSWNFVVITDEEYPRVFPVRQRELESGETKKFKAKFGPFPHGTQLKEALRIIRKIFPFRGEKDSVKKKRGVSGLNQEIGLLPKFGEGGLSRKEYLSRIRHIKLFFDGKKGQIVKELERKMKESAKQKDFEKAAELRNQIFALHHIRDVSLIKNLPPTTYHLPPIRIEGYDVAHTSGRETVGVMVAVEDGEPNKSEYRMFKIRQTTKGSDTDALKETIERRLGHPEWPLPKLFVVDGGKAQLNVVRKVLDDSGVSIPVVSVVKDERHRPKNVLGEKKYTQKYEGDILLANSEAHRFGTAYHSKLRGKVRKR